MIINIQYLLKGWASLILGSIRMQLSKNFSLQELLQSDTADKQGFKEQYTPSQEIVDNLQGLCVNILQPLREALGVPIKVNSGYRCFKLNDYIGGVATSDHLKGQAADIQLVGLPNSMVTVAAKLLNLPYNQIIHEYGTVDKPLWIHISHRQEDNKYQILVKSQNKPYRALTTAELLDLAGI
jgi:hypothetical protein